ncbi:glycosyl hydrolase family 18 protein [Mucilaginibacter sp.]|uniref:glycosyl hydrolase family 18 protein n=1 Tax=Mucilaginibacter sp. TaxID=1882438 RepID=UPI0025D82DCD|nr:glycosyl hydrolase family 18 protein [Mucilaginibacter sp.]
MRTNKLFNCAVFSCMAIAVLLSGACKKDKSIQALNESLTIAKKGSNLKLSSLPGGKRVFAYFAENDHDYGKWIDSTHTDLITDICIIGELYDSQGVLPTTPSITTFITKAHLKGLRTFIAIGGAYTYGATLLQPANRPNYIHNLVTYLVSNNFDGIDLDYEGSQITSNYNDFVVQLSDSLQVHSKLLSMAIASYQGNSISTAAYGRVDFLNPMIYDYTHPGSPQSHATLAEFQSDVDFFLTKVPAAKMNAGIPAYAWTYVNNQPTNQVGFNSAVAVNVNLAFVNHATISATEQWFYDGHPVIRKKIAYALSKNLGGVMFFHLTCDTKDDRTSLLKLISYCFANPNGFNPADKYILANTNSGNIISVSGGSLTNGAAVVQGSASPANANMWNINFVSGANFSILNVNSGKALDVTGASTANNAPLAQWPYGSGLNQMYTLSPNDLGNYVITSVNSGKAIEILGSSTAIGASVVQNPANGSYNQQWVLEKL